MLAIVNVTKDDHQEVDDYELRVNRRVIAIFHHKRSYNGAAQCLRDAADALDAIPRDLDLEFLKSLLPTFKQMENQK